MRLANFAAALRKRPFRPFEIRADGEVIPVQHPEQVFLAEQKTTVIVDVGNRIHILDLEQISKVTILRRSASNGSKLK